MKFSVIKILRALAATLLLLSMSTPAFAAECHPTLHPMVKDDRTVPAEWRDPAELVFGLGDAAKQQLSNPVGPIPAGTAWMIGATQQAGVPWLGANTQHPSLLEHTPGDVAWEITKFDGPGAMFVFTQGGLGQVVGEEWFRGVDGQAQGSHTIPANSHVHPNWMFSAPGTYTVTVRQSATTSNGEPVSGEATLTFDIGGAGNANDGHFDFGSVFDEEGECAQPVVASNANPAPDQGETQLQSQDHQQQDVAPAQRGGALAETGTTVMTLPVAVLGLGVFVFGAGWLCLDASLRRRVAAAWGFGGHR
ncbi:TIGR03773 family transporter-associated surface protein [uncultured Corynebacterium sp.]|uniref:TIGR03773 family transporter-associated surface protein n=1 Tax=uncultured Corynebacterium sp. TaxID=159447 RepID=UPI002599F268|nr:TIGR03773 family transporter-associated surface protein [uncultured Corynebacterium sp.]